MILLFYYFCTIYRVWLYLGYFLIRKLFCEALKTLRMIERNELLNEFKKKGELMCLKYTLVDFMRDCGVNPGSQLFDKLLEYEKRKNYCT